MEPPHDHQQIDPTLPVNPPSTKNEPAKQNPYADLDYLDIPPPPPLPHTRRYLGIIAVLISIVLVLSAGLAYALLANAHPRQEAPLPARQATSIMNAHHAFISPTTSLTPALTSTTQQQINLHYTATDLVDDFLATGLKLSSIQYGQTIYSWTGNMYVTSVWAQSSATWTDSSTCNGPCSPADLGIWVYNSQSDAQTAYAEVLQDEHVDGSVPMMDIQPSSTFTHGRCLLLGAGDNSLYVQLTAQNCI